MSLVLAIDLGGTKTALALYDARSGALVRTVTVRSADATGLEPIVTAFLAGDRVEAAALGVAGPVREGVCRTTNLPWVVSREALATLLGTPHVTLMNDVEAACWGASATPADHRRVLHAADADDAAPTTLVMIGTGFGRATLAYGHALASEAGHVRFAPRTSREWALVEHLAALHGTPHVSVERVLSGRGVLDVHDFVRRDHDGAPPASSATALTALADAGDPAAKEAVGWLVSIVGAVLGDVALETLPRGGLFLAGGVALGLAGHLGDTALVRAYLDKGPMADLVGTIPLTFLDTAGLGLLGARAVALRRR